MSRILNISSLSIGYKKTTLLKNINISCHSNNFVAIIGRNGKGKSTLLRTIAGLQDPKNGNIMFNGIDVLNLAEKNRAKLLSVVLSIPSSLNNITVFEYIAFGRYPYTNWLGINKETDNHKINEAITLCKIDYLKEKIFNELSDGEKQKVNIARAITQNTPLIILDEPTAHLDLVNRVEIFKLLKDLASNYNKLIIISTHQIEIALQLCNEIWLINNNKITQCDSKSIIESNMINELFGSDTISFNPINNKFEIS